MTFKQQIEKIVDDWIVKNGYIPTIDELKTAYTNGELVLNDIQENAMIELINN